MSRVLMSAVLLAGWGVQSAPAQAPLRFGWKAGQVLTYKVEQETHALDVTSDGKVETTTRLALTKRWQVHMEDWFTRILSA